MKRILTFACQVSSCLVFCHSISAAPPPSAAFAGTYRVERIKKDRQSIPTNFFDFSLTLKPDGSFVVTNVPADFFFDYTPTPATREAKGTWNVEHRSEGGSFLYTGENDYLDLNFTSAPELGSWQRLIHSNLIGQPWMRMWYHSGKSDSLVFNLKRVAP